MSNRIHAKQTDTMIIMINCILYELSSIAICNRERVVWMRLIKFMSPCYYLVVIYPPIFRLEPSPNGAIICYELVIFQVNLFCNKISRWYKNGERSVRKVTKITTKGNGLGWNFIEWQNPFVLLYRNNGWSFFM